MIDKNKELLDKVIADRLATALSSDMESKEYSVAFNQAMEAIDRKLEMTKMDVSSDEQAKKQAAAKREAYVNWAIRVAEIGIGVMIMPIVKHCMGRRDMKDLCMFEKDYTFTTSAAKSCSKSRFRFW